MSEWEKSIVSSEASIETAIRKLDSSAFRFVTVIDSHRRLVGVLTDGDIRRSILNHIPLSEPVKIIMSKNPITAHSKTSKSDLLAIMRRNCLHHIPLINERKEVVDVLSIDKILGLGERSNWVVLMAGGLGTRLKPFTHDCPKPMLEIGEKPILEIIMESFIAQGFRKFYFSVNYLADVIKQYFGDGSQFGVEIRYLQEEQKLGTAGSLSLIDATPQDNLIVMNGDILTSVNFDDMIKFHEENESTATMAVRQYEFQVPYGVVNVKGPSIIDFDEKPRHKFFINAGIYVLAPCCLTLIPKKTEYDMPSLFSKLNKINKKSVPYPLHEKWLDIGEVESFQHAKTQWRAEEEVVA